MTTNIKSVYRNLKCDRIHQGDVLKNFRFPIIINENGNDDSDYTTVEYGIILSQDCDLDGVHMLYSNIQNTAEISKENPINGNKYLPSIILAPAFYADEVNKGNYLLKMGLKMDNKGRVNKSKWKAIENNNNPRYHYIKDKSDNKMPDLIVDFKIFYTLPYDYLYLNHPKHYECSLNELIREDLSQRFFNYHSRIGLPEFDDER